MLDNIRYFNYQERGDGFSDECTTNFKRLELIKNPEIIQREKFLVASKSLIDHVDCIYIYLEPSDSKFTMGDQRGDSCTMSLNEFSEEFNNLITSSEFHQYAVKQNKLEPVFNKIASRLKELLPNSLEEIEQNIMFYDEKKPQGQYKRFADDPDFFAKEVKLMKEKLNSSYQNLIASLKHDLKTATQKKQ